jgi:hypothetical protein
VLHKNRMRKVDSVGGVYYTCMDKGDIVPSLSADNSKNERQEFLFIQIYFLFMYTEKLN